MVGFDVIGAALSALELLLWLVMGAVCLLQLRHLPPAACNALGLSHLLMPIYLTLLSLAKPHCFSGEITVAAPHLLAAAFALLSAWLLHRTQERQASWLSLSLTALSATNAVLGWLDEQGWQRRAPELACDFSAVEAFTEPLAGGAALPLLAACVLLGSAFARSKSLRV